MREFRYKNGGKPYQRKPPKRLILDFDATDITVHGEQEQRFFHGCYDSYCFMPLYVFCGRHILVSYLRYTSRHAWQQGERKMHPAFWELAKIKASG